jgi:hypothetical protein
MEHPKQNSQQHQEARVISIFDKPAYAYDMMDAFVMSHPCF